LFFLFRDQTSKKEILNQRHNSSFFANLWKREMSHMQEFLLDIHGEMVEVLEDHSIRNHRIESLQARIEKQAAFISQQQIQINLQASEIEELRRKNHALELENQSLRKFTQHKSPQPFLKIKIYMTNSRLNKHQSTY